jgi:hypothetical protein
VLFNIGTNMGIKEIQNLMSKSIHPNDSIECKQYLNPSRRDKGGYPDAITQKCPKCGRTFTCKGTGWKREWVRFGVTKGKCPYANRGCYCEKCHHGKTRSEGCEETFSVENSSEKDEMSSM